MQIIELTDDHGEIIASDWLRKEQAHKFCFREGMVVSSFHFVKKLA